jgi:N-acetylmuramic acid 6-phosphate etherase
MMVDVQSTNVKLTKRKAAMVAFLTGGTEEEAQRALERARGNVKLAVLLSHGCDSQAAENALRRAEGNLREAIDLIYGADHLTRVQEEGCHPKERTHPRLKNG